MSYFIGSIPFGLILTKIFTGKDVREIGSGNIGATNVLRTGNKYLAAITLLLDVLKGYVAIIITKQYFPELIIFSSLLVFLGHLFPVWLKFKGGKGVATYLGILFALSLQLSLSELQQIYELVGSNLIGTTDEAYDQLGNLIDPVNFNNLSPIFHKRLDQNLGIQIDCQMRTTDTSPQGSMAYITT